MTVSSLYSRMGGYDLLAQVVDDFLARLLREPVLERFSVGMNGERQLRNRQLTLDFLANATGGPTLYLGQDMRTAHRGLGITVSDWEIAAKHFRLAVEKCDVPERETSELLAAFESVRDSVVEK